MSHSVIDLKKAQNERNESRRHDVERVLFRHMLGCYCVIERKGLKSVQILDISQEGMRFRMLAGEGTFTVGEELAFRLYFSQETYLPAYIVIKWSKPILENGMDYVEYGAEFDKSLASHDALTKLVEFVSAYAKYFKKDDGDKQVWFL